MPVMIAGSNLKTMHRFRVEVIQEKNLMITVFTKYHCILLSALLILAALAATIQPAQSDENVPIFSYGSGPYELIIFTDYFCVPCQKIEKELNKTVFRMIEQGKAKVTFVDLPIYKLTPLYGTYFLYTLNAKPDYKEALRARRLLFEKASRLSAIQDRHLENALRAANIAIKPYGIKQSLDKYKSLIKKYKVRSTPTFVFIFLSADVRKYSGSKPIRKGMAEFLQAIDQR